MSEFLNQPQSAHKNKDADQGQPVPALFENEREAVRQRYEGEEGDQILREYAEAEQQKIARGEKTDAEFSIPALKNIVTPQAEMPQESEPGWKERRKRAEIQTKNLEEGRKNLTRYATSYTMPFMEYEQQGGVRGFHAGKVEDIPPQQLADMKKSYFEKKWSIHQFDEEYMKEHYAEVRGEMKLLRNFLDVFKDGTGLTSIEAARIKALEVVYKAMDETLTAFLAMHCLERGEGDHPEIRVKNAPVPADAADKYNEKREFLRSVLEKSEKAEIEQIFARRPSPNFVPGGAVSDFLNEISGKRDSVEFTQNEAMIDRMTSDLKRISDLWEYAKWDMDSLQKIKDDLKSEGAADDDRRIQYVENKIDRLSPRVKAFGARVEEIMHAASFLLEGNEEKTLTESEEKLLLSYRRADPENEYRERVEYIDLILTDDTYQSGTGRDMYGKVQRNHPFGILHRNLVQRRNESMRDHRLDEDEMDALIHYGNVDNTASKPISEMSRQDISFASMNTVLRKGAYDEHGGKEMNESGVVYESKLNMEYTTRMLKLMDRVSLPDDTLSFRYVSLHALCRVLGIRTPEGADNDTFRTLLMNQMGKTNKEHPVVSDSGFWSSTPIPHPTYADNPVRFFIYAPEGTKALYADSIYTQDGTGIGETSEYELLFQAGTKFRVLKMEPNPDNPNMRMGDGPMFNVYLEATGEYDNPLSKTQ